MNQVQARSRSAARSLQALYEIDLREIWYYLKRERASFWFVNAYLMLEYVRPQSIYSALAGPPWTSMSILAALAALLLEGKFTRRMTLADVWLVIFTFTLLLSSVLAYDPGISFDFVPDFITWILIYYLITTIVSNERRFFVFMFGYLLYNLKMSQHATRSWAGAGFAFRDWGTTGAPGWFHNSGEFGIQMNIYLPLAVLFYLALRDHWGRWRRAFFLLVIVSVVTGTVGSSSRGAMIGMVGVAAFLFARSHHKLKAGLGLVALLIFGFFLLPEESLDRFRSMGEDETSMSRRVYWEAGLRALKENPVTGIGYANWPSYMDVRYEVMGLPHNIFVQAAAELGYLGLAALVGLIVAHFVVNARTRRMLKGLQDRGRFLSMMSIGLDGALVGFLISGSFVTVLYYPFLWINLAMTVALHNSARHTLRQERRAAQAFAPPSPPAHPPLPRPV